VTGRRVGQGGAHVPAIEQEREPQQSPCERNKVTWRRRTAAPRAQEPGELTRG
jgi:hypothetical protein